MAGHDIGVRGASLTRLQGLNGERGLCQEVGVTEHVLLIHHEPQEGKFGIIDVEHKLLHHPDGVQAVIRCGGRKTPSV